MRTRNLSWLAPLAVALLTVACSSTDVGVTSKVKAKLAVDDVVKGSEIEVTSQNGVVTLKGNIDSQEAKDRALALARETKGVVEVTDLISVKRATGDGDAPEPDRTVGATIDDAATTMRVKNRLLDDPTVKGSAIDVDTRDGIVYLTGSVRSEQEKEQAIKLARETKGAKDVQANLTIGKG